MKPVTCFITGCKITGKLLVATVVLSLSFTVMPVMNVAAAAGPDLIVQSITCSPENPSIGNTATFTVIIKNRGDASSGLSHVAYYMDDNLLESDLISPLDPGISESKTFTSTAEAGSHTFKVIADKDNEVSESDETNNNKSFAFSTLAPDLVVQDITWSPENPSAEDTVTLTVTVKNQGTATARASYIEMFIDGSSRGQQDMQKIEAGDTHSATFIWNAKHGTHSIKAVADCANQVMENDETNNQLSLTLVTMAPDLIVETITWSPTNPSKGDDVTFTATITNQGLGRADYSYVAYYVDDLYVTSEQINPLEAGVSANSTFVWRVTTGSHNIKAIADQTKWITENDETNNTKTVEFSPLTPDLIIENITWSPATPSKGDDVTVTVTVKNQGLGRAGSCRVSCYISGAPTGIQDTGIIEAGDSRVLYFNWEADAGEIIIKADADSNELITETDETNNSKTVNLSSLPPDLIIDDITWSPANPAVGDTVTFTVSIKNQGSGLAISSRVFYYINDAFLKSDYVPSISADTTANCSFTWEAVFGSHKIKAVANANDQIIEIDSENNEKTLTLTTAVPDLIIENITWSPQNPVEGEDVTITADVKNQGTSQASNIRIAYYVDNISSGYYDITELGAGDTQKAVFPWTAESGPHTFKIVADAEKVSLESNEDNNTRTANLPPPDLVILDISFSPPDIRAGETIAITTTAKNQGSGPAKDIRVAYHVDGQLAGYADIAEIAAGDSKQATFSWIATAGSQTLTATADGPNQITESDENNNQKASDIAVMSPDLIIEDIAWSLEASGDINFSVTVKNAGNSKADNLRVTYYLDGTNTAYFDIPVIEGGAVATKFFTATAETGSHTIRLIADEGNSITEGNETNNEKTLKFSTLAPDLIIQEVTWSPVSANAGDTITFSVVIKNQGSHQSDVCRVTCYIDDTAIGQDDVRRMDAGTTVTRFFSWKAEEGSHNFRVIADLDEVIIESNEGNNTSNYDLSFSAPPAEANLAKPTIGQHASEAEGMGSLWWVIYGAAGLLIAGMIVALVKSRKS